MQVALCSALDLPALGSTPPDWVHLLPAGDVRTVDGRGPYRVPSLARLVASLEPGAKLPIDENYATDKGGALGKPAPARGWIVGLEARPNGLWGKVEWTQTGRTLIADKAYRGISPAILHNQSGDVIKVLRASLTNLPNLVGLTSLHTASPGAAPSSMGQRRQLTEVDANIMKAFDMTEEEYLRQLDQLEASGKSVIEPIGVGSSLYRTNLNSVDRQMMQLFSINEADWRAALQAQGFSMGK